MASKLLTKLIQPSKIVKATRGVSSGVKSSGAKTVKSTANKIVGYSGQRTNTLVKNITSSDNLFSQLQEKNPEVSNKRGTRTIFNMLGTFGTERNEKIIRMNLQLLRNTLVETFEIAKLLRMNASGGVSGPGGDSLMAGVGLAAAGAGIVGLGALVGKKISDFIAGSGDGGDGSDKQDSKEDDGGGDAELFINEEEKIVNKELEGTEDVYDEDKLDSDLEESSRGINNLISDGYTFLTDSINKLIKGEDVNVEEETGDSDDSSGIKIEDDDVKSESDQLSTLVDGVQNSFRDVLKNEVAEGESNNDYGAMYSRDQEGFSRGNEDITKMTINEVDALQTDYLNYQTSVGREDGDRSAAMGAYQMLNPKKVAELMGLDPEKTIFDKETQDMMSEYYLKYSGLEDFEAGKITAEEFNNRLAEQFASIETTSGEGVYDDDGMNKAKNNIMDILKPAESKFKGLEDGAFLPGDKPGEIIVVNQGQNVTPIPGGSGKKVAMVNQNTGKPRNAGPTQEFIGSSNPDDSNIATKSILGVVG